MSTAEMTRTADVRTSLDLDSVTDMSVREESGISAAPVPTAIGGGLLLALLSAPKPKPSR